MMKLAALFCAFALVTAQTTTDGPEVESTVTTTFDGDCYSLMADSVAMAVLIVEINTQVSAGFGGADVSTTLACGSIIGTTTVSGGVAPTAPLVVTSTDLGAATILIVTGGGGSGSGGAGRYAEGGKAGKGMSGEAGKGGKKGMGGEMGFGKGMGSGKGMGGEKGSGKGMGGEKGSGKGEGGEKGGKGTYGSLNASATSGINRNSAAAISAGIVLVAGLGLITVRRLRSNQGYEMVTHSEMGYVTLADEKTELLRVDTQA